MGDAFVVIGECNHPALAVVHVAGGDAVAVGSDAVSEAVVEIALIALAGQAVGGVEAVVCSAQGFQLAFEVVAERGGVGLGEPVFSGVVAVAAAGIDELIRRFGFGDQGLGAVAVGIQGILIVGQDLAVGAVRQPGQAVGVVVAVVAQAAVEVADLREAAGSIVAVAFAFAQPVQRDAAQAVQGVVAVVDVTAAGRAGDGISQSAQVVGGVVAVPR